MSDGWIEIVEGGELPEMGEPVLVGGYEWYAIARREMVMTEPGHFGRWEWRGDFHGEPLHQSGRFPQLWREIPR